jgi:cell division ATPase FtsA
MSDELLSFQNIYAHDILYAYMRIVLVLKPYAIEVYSREADVYTLVSVEQSARIEGESLYDYEKRMIFVCKDMCMEMHGSAYYKDIAHKIKGIDVVLSAPWCTYEVIHVEKDLGKKTKITQALVASLSVKKDEKDLRLIESYTSRILLNGYTVPAIDGQFAQYIQLQYVHVYAQETFVSLLMKSLETIFHTHAVLLTSIYGSVEYISQKRNTTHVSEMKIILEEESMDVSYVYEGAHITSMFIPYGQHEMEHDVAMKLSADIVVTQDILRSRIESMRIGSVQDEKVTNNKNAKNIWPDLDPSTKQIVDDSISKHMEKIIQHIRDCVDTIDVEFLKTSSRLTIYGANTFIATVYGKELAEKISADPYISMKIPLYMEKDSIVSIF